VVGGRPRTTSYSHKSDADKSAQLRFVFIVVSHFWLWHSMLLLELLSILQNSNTSLLFWNFFTGLKFLNELNTKSSLSLTKFSIPLSLCVYSASSQSQHTFFTWCHSHQTIIITLFTQSHSSILPTCFTSSLEPASYITQNSSSKLLIPLSATFIWTCRFNLPHSAITFYHFFTVSLWAQKLPFQKILSSTLVCFCLSDWLRL